MTQIVSPLSDAATLQLPVCAYFDEKLFEEEKRLIFDAGPGYAGHELMVPSLADYRSTEWLDHAKLLVHTEQGFHQLSNICRHRQAVMVQGSGRTDNIVCPVHRWTYDTHGQQVGAPHFPQNPCLNLEKNALERWQGLLFKGPRSPVADLADMQFAEALNFKGYKLDRVEIHACNYNWKTFIEVYLEDYHVAPFHPGLGNFVTCDDLTWQFGQWFSVQRVGLTAFEKSGSPVYGRYQEALKNTLNGTKPQQGAIWLTYFPNVMVEWYPNVLVVSSLIPTDVNKTTNVVEFYYPEEVAEFERDFVAAQQAAYMETAIEDDDIGERMDRGRYALYKAGRNEVGPYQTPFEDGMAHFHAFYRQIMGEALRG